MTELLVASQILLWVVFLALSAVVFALARQIGVLHERIAPLGALMVDGGVEVGDAAPRFALTDVLGRPVTIGGRREGGRSTLLLFISPDCPVCKKLLAVVRWFMRSEGRSLDLVLVGDGDPEDHRKLLEAHGLGQVPLVIAPEVGMRFQVGKLPYAILIDDQGIVRSKGLVNSREHLESLLVAKETGYVSIQAYLAAKAGDPEQAAS